jgi:subtilisin family serine protease/LAS superfamily LD-carboxypeptidase LdcB
VDPALWELLRAEAGADGDRVLEAIIRLSRPDVEIPDVQIVARFGPVATCRILARDVVPVRALPEVVSFKAAHALGPGSGPAADATRPRAGLRPTDVRRRPGLALTGRDVVVAAVDWGVDVDSAAFRWPEPAAGPGRTAGGTRLLALWDQRDLAAGPRPEPYGYGTVHDRAQIDDALRHPRPYERLGYHPAIADRSGRGTHGTHVLDIAAGNGQAGGPLGVAPEADLAFVHLADRTTGGLANLGDSVRLLEAVDFISRTAGSLPCVINISAGRTCGPKDGSTLVERALDELLAATPGRFVVNSAGNYFGWRTHSCGVIGPGESRSLTFVIDPADITVNELEVWYDGADEFAVRVDPPGYAGGRAVLLGERSDLLINGDVAGRIYHRRHDPNNGDNQIVVYIDPLGHAGEWTVTLEARQVSSGRFHAWIERDDTCRGCQARFTPADSSPVTTIGTITTSRLPLVVGAYDGHDPGRPVAPFSSSGPSRDLRIKPDMGAPGVDILAARSASAVDDRNPGLLVRKSGTSMAAPHVTGAVALCLEAAGHALSAGQIRSLVLGSCDPVPDPESPHRVGCGYLNIPRLIADLERTLTAPGAKEPIMYADDSIVLLSTVPATAYREYLYRPHGRIARWIGDRFDVVARPGERPGHVPRPGDVLLEVALGRHGPGRCLVLAADDPELDLPSRGLSAGQLLLRPRRRTGMSEPLAVEPAADIPGPDAIFDEIGDADDADAPRWTGTPEQIQFRDRVLQARLDQRRRRGAPQRDLSRDELDFVPGTRILTARATALAAGRLLDAARAALRAAQQAGDPDAQRTVRLTVTSGYRSNSEQRTLWLGYFSAEDGYYDQTRVARSRIPEGPHSKEAVKYMLRPEDEGGFGLGGKIAAPGYSNHQGGIAIDLLQERVAGHRVRNDSRSKARARWRSTWFHKWLKVNAAGCGFCPIRTEEWHWEYRPAAAAAAVRAAAAAAAADMPAVVAAVAPAVAAVPAALGAFAPAAAAIASAVAAPDDASVTDHLGGKLWTFIATAPGARTAVFCPRAALGQAKVDVLIFAHGLLSGCDGPRRPPSGFITDSPFGLGRVVDATGRPTVLVVPFLDWANPGGEHAFGPGHSGWHALALPRHLNDLVTQALAEVGRVQAMAAPALNKLIITGHSRAHSFLEPLAHSRADPAMDEGPLARLSLVGAFDTTYKGEVDHWTDWLAQRRSLTARFYYRPADHRTATVGKAFYQQRGGRLFVEQVEEGHCLVPATRLPSVLAAAAPAGGTTDDDQGLGEGTAKTFTPPVIPSLSGATASSHTIAWHDKSVEVHFFPGTSTSGQTLLILAGVHQDERKALEVSKKLLAELQSGPGKPFSNVVFIPDLFGKRQVTTPDIKGVPTNRNSPRQDESLADAAQRGKGTPKDASKKAHIILPENVILFALVEALKPRASLSIHSHRIITDAKEICTEGAASVTVDPKPGSEEIADYLAKEMALAATRAHIPVPGNQVTGDSARTRYPTQLARHEDGVTFGQWGSHQGGMNQYLIETEGKEWPPDPKAAPSAAQLAEISAWTQVIWSTFLASPGQVTTATVTRDLAREWDAVTGQLNW